MKTMNLQMKKRAFLLTSFIFFYLFLPAGIFAQGWEKLIGAGDRDFGIAIVPSQDGNYVLGGMSYDGLGIDPARDVYLMKIDIHGNILWTQFHGITTESEFIKDLIPTDDGGYLIAGWSGTSSGRTKPYLIKTDSLGQEEWSNNYDTGNFAGEINKVIEANGGGYIFTGYEDRGPNDDLTIGKVAANGDLIWMKSFDESLNDQTYDLVETLQGEIVVTGFTDGGNNDNDYLLMKVDGLGNKVWSTTSDTIRVARFIHLHPNGHLTTIGDRSSSANGSLTRIDENGNILWTKNTSIGYVSFIRDAITTVDGGFLLTGQGFESPQRPVVNLFLTKLDSLGNEEWEHFYGGNLSTQGVHMVQTPDEGYLATGYQFIDGTVSQEDIYLLKVDSLGRLYSNIINGRIVHDTSMDCQADSAETGLVNWIVEAQKSNGQQFFGSSDSTGYYEVNADTGDYQVILHPVNPYWMACADSLPLTLNNFYDTTEINFAMQADINCPYLIVDVATPFLRRCFDNIYTVNYCNEGTLIADSAYVDITLDPFMDFISSSIPAQMIGPDLYRFQLGDLPVGTCDRFNFTINLDCDSTILGQTHCVEAHIYPDSLCFPINSNWSGAFIEVGAACQDSFLNFKIENTGSGSMNGPLNYVIIEDAILLMTAPFELGPGIAQDIPLPNNGSSYLIYAQQEPGAPGNSVPILSVEGCVINPGTPFSSGFINQFPQNDLDPFIEIDCRQSRGSYDPNDKQAFPAGYSAEHLIEANTEIEYFIRFQNTGTDTAFKVVVQDTLSSWLDPATIHPGASSHPYTFNLSKDGILTFTFDNILLPDSTANYAASNGFIKFRIAQKADNPIGTRIENRAAIFFDFNAPILTNTTFHTIGEDLIDIILDTENPDLPQAMLIKVYPNPLQQSAQFDLGEIEINRGQFDLYSSSGQLIRQHSFTGNQFTFERKNLAAGFYFFSIKDQGKLIGQGKLIVR